MIKKLYFNVYGKEDALNDQNTFSLNFNTETKQFFAVDKTLIATSTVVNQLSIGTLNTEGGAPTITLSAGTNISIENDIINCTLTGLSQLTNDAGFVTTDTTYSNGNGIVITSGNAIAIDTDFLSGFVENLGYIKVDNDTTYAADENSIVMDSNRVFSVSESWLNEIINGKGFLTAHQDISNLALKSEIPVVTGFATKEELPTKVSDLDNDTGFITGYTDTTYSNGTGITITSANIVEINQEWLEGFVANLGYIKVDNDTTYAADEDTIVMDSNRVFSVNTTWLDNYLNSKAYLTEIPSTYAQLSDIPAIPTGVSAFDNDAGYLTEAPTKVSQLTNDKGYVTLADLEAVKATLLEAMIPTNMEVYQAIEGNINEPTKNVFIATSSVISTNTTFTGKTVTVTELNNENSYTKFTASGDVTINNLNSEGTLPKAQSNGQILINTPGRVVITDCELNQNGYNVAEIGLAAGDPPKSVLIDGINFTGTASNNAISIYGTADDAIITISNCTFKKVSNALRISNRTNASGVIVNIENCEFTEWESNPDYAGMILFQDYTSTTAEAAQTNNLFGNGKIIVNIINCTHAGQKIEMENPADICGSRNANQVIYVYYDKGGLVAYDENKYPIVSVQ